MIPIEKLTALRKLMKINNMDAWIVPSADPHQSEYVAARWKSRAWISGFTGSAGTVVITADKAGLWTDSRYFLQAEKELENSTIELFKEGLPETPSFIAWLEKELHPGACIGFDGKLLPVSQVRDLETTLAFQKITLAYQQDLVDDIWKDRPAIPMQQAFILDEQFAGESRVSKFKRVRKEMQNHHAQYHVFPALDDIAWLFNIRGTDVDYNPVVYAYAVISDKETLLFIDKGKLSQKVEKSLTTDKVIIKEYNEFFNYLAHLPEATVIIDPEKTSQVIMDSISKSCSVIDVPSIAFELKTCKNAVELEGIRKAHIRDGVALVKWFIWLKDNIGIGNHTEITIADKLEEIRKTGENFRGLSFDTIAGYKGNGAIVHYSAKPESAAKIFPDGLLLIDSGGQYLDGTTDITRTISLGNITDEEKKCYTLVLKGHINLGKVIFPRGYNGSQLDILARAAMFENYMNYGHGTGHGVGHFLNVHEGPQRIRPENNVPLKIGMLTSNEPGLYIKNKFGIRIENLVVTEEKCVNEFGTFYGFETVTMCPISLDLVKIEMLTDTEKAWLNAYHHKVYEKLSPFLNDAEKKWLAKETREI